MNALTSLFPNKTVMDCFLMYLALNLCGRYDSKMLLVLQWFKKNVLIGSGMKKIITSLFGDYCSTLCDLNNIFESNDLTDFFDAISGIRLLVVESVNKFTHADISQLIIDKCITHKQKGKAKTQKFPIDFSMLCFCNNEPSVDDLVTNNIGYIRVAEQENGFGVDNIVVSDLFLVLVEYVNIFEGNNMFSTIRYTKAKNIKQLDAEKYCRQFEEMFIEKASVNFYTKSAHVHDEYVKWCTDNNYPILLKTHFFEYFKTKYDFHKSVRIPGVATPTTAFNLILKKR